jgi:hypothetical protein|nr:MAG TPA: hypothetical protein [Caudoviricetes sp.]DAV34293.1 MAG TPA: hypothetical protein [Caudoviricetes sp.]
MIDERVFLGFPKNFDNLCKIYPPKIKDVIGNDKFPLYKRILTLSQEEIEDEFTEKGLDLANMLSPFETLFTNAYNNEEMRQLTNDAFFFFIHEPIMLLYEQKKIIIGDIEKVLKKIEKIDDLKIIDDSNFFNFQNEVRAMLGEKKIDPPNPNEDPRLKRMKAKARYRDRVKAKSGKGLQLGSSLASLCCMGFGLNPLSLGELSYASVPILIRYYQEKEKYQLDVDSLLAGADAKKVKPKYWVRNIDMDE